MTDRARPRALSPDDVLVAEVAEEPAFQPGSGEPDDDFAATPDAPQAAEVVAPTGKSKNSGWLNLLLLAVGGLLSLSVSLWAYRLIGAVLARKDWVGWTGFSLLIIAGCAALVLLAREIDALFRLRHLGKLREKADQARENSDEKLAKSVLAEVTALYAERKDLAWISDYTKSAPKTGTALEQLAAFEANVLRRIDREAVSIIEQASQRVSAVTVLSPFIIFDILAILTINIRLLRRISELYGGGPGLASAIRLGRLAIAQIFIDAGLELAGDFIPSTLVRGAGFFGRKVGEGLVNGFMTARIGTNAMRICRPVPFLDGRKPNPMKIFGRISARYAASAGKYVYEQGKDAVGRAASGVAKSAADAVSGIAQGLTGSRKRGDPEN